MNNNKVSIVMMSTFSGPSFKGPQMPEIIIELEKQGRLGNCYGLYSPTDKKHYTDSILHKLRSNRFLKVLFKLNELTCKLFKIELRYYFNERIFGLFAMLHRYDGDIILLKPRPAFLTKYFKRKGKKIIIEASENYSWFTYHKIQAECKHCGIPMAKSIFTNQKAVRDYEEGIKFSDSLICLSQFSSQTYLDAGYKGKITVVNLETQITKIRKIDTQGDGIVFTTVANHSILKGTFRLLHIWKTNNFKNKLYVIGDIHDDLRSLIKTIDLPNTIVFTGSVSREKVTELYLNNNCVNILVSVSESYGRTIYEALCISTPVIVTHTCTCDLVKDGYNGFIVDNNNEEIECAVKRFIDMPICDYFKFRENAINSVSENRKSFAKQYVACLVSTD